MSTSRECQGLRPVEAGMIAVGFGGLLALILLASLAVLLLARPAEGARAEERTARQPSACALGMPSGYYVSPRLGYTTLPSAVEPSPHREPIC